MPKDLPEQSYSENFREQAGVASARFWRNVILIALAHVAILLALIRWSVEARNSANAQSVVWISGAEDLASEGPESGASPQPAMIPTPPPESKPLEKDAASEETPFVTAAKSEIELPAQTPTPTAIPKPPVTSIPRPKATPKQTPASTPKKAVLAKVSPERSTKTKPTSTKSSARAEKTADNAEKKKSEKDGTTKTASSSQAAGKGSSGSKNGHTGGGNNESEFGWYGNMLHDRFYSAWIQPTTNVPSGAKISTLVNVRIEKDGRVSIFEIIKPSENVVVNESVAAVAKQVTEVDSPPAGLIKGDHYDVKINFELNTEEGR
jgi:outer membrane biosynthesis protein TonB